MLTRTSGFLRLAVALAFQSRRDSSSSMLEEIRKELLGEANRSASKAILHLDDLFWLLKALLDTVHSAISPILSEAAEVAVGPIQGPLCYVLSRLRRLGEAVTSNL